MVKAARPAAGRAWIAGATGLVGRELVRECLQRGAEVHALVRRAPEAPDPRVHWHVVDFARLERLPAAAGPGDVALCALGTTIKVAGSQAAFRAVDHDAVLAFARAAHRAGVRRLAVVSALGANAKSSNFYSRVKGETEDGLRAIGFRQLAIARPSLLAGARETLGQPARPGERITLALTAPLAPLIPKAWRPIEAAVVARGMLAALDSGGDGVQVVASGRLQEIGT